MTNPEFAESPKSDTLFYPWGSVKLSQRIRALGLEPVQLYSGEKPPFSTNSFITDPNPFYPEIRIVLSTQNEGVAQLDQPSLSSRSLNIGLPIHIEVPPNELLIDTEKKFEVIAMILEEISRQQALFDYHQDRPKESIMDGLRDLWFNLRTRHDPPPTTKELDFRLNKDDFNEWITRDLVITFLGVPPPESPDLQFVS